MTNLEKYPNTGGVPPTLFTKRMEGESFEEFKEREKSNHQFLNDYFRQPMGERMRPSVRVLKRVRSGKRSINDLKPSERNHIKYAIGFERYREFEEAWLSRLHKFLLNLDSEIGTKEFWKDLKEVVNEHRDSQ